MDDGVIKTVKKTIRNFKESSSLEWEQTRLNLLSLGYELGKFKEVEQAIKEIESESEA